MEPRRPKRNGIEPEFLLMAYGSGYFPMADSAEGEIGWYSPDPRAIMRIEPDRLPQLSSVSDAEPLRTIAGIGGVVGFVGFDTSR